MLAQWFTTPAVHGEIPSTFSFVPAITVHLYVVVYLLCCDSIFIVMLRTLEIGPEPTLVYTCRKLSCTRSTLVQGSFTLSLRIRMLRVLLTARITTMRALRKHWVRSKGLSQLLLVVFVLLWPRIHGCGFEASSCFRSGAACTLSRRLRSRIVYITVLD